MLLACYIIWSLKKHILVKMTEIIWDMMLCLLISIPAFRRRLLLATTESRYHWSEEFLDVLCTVTKLLRNVS